MKGGLGSPGRFGGVCNCSGCIKLRADEVLISEITEKLQLQISILKESVEQSIVRLQKELEETIQRLEEDAAEKIEKIKNGGE